MHGRSVCVKPRNEVSGKNKERWMEVCEQAATEHDPEKLAELVHELNDLLAARFKDVTPHPLPPESD